MASYISYTGSVRSSLDRVVSRSTHNVVSSHRSQVSHETIERPVWDAGYEFPFIVQSLQVVRADHLDHVVIRFPSNRRLDAITMPRVEENHRIPVLDSIIVDERPFQGGENRGTRSLLVVELDDATLRDVQRIREEVDEVGTVATAALEGWDCFVLVLIDRDDERKYRFVCDCEARPSLVVPLLEIFLGWLKALLCRRNTLVGRCRFVTVNERSDPQSFGHQ